MPIDPVCLMEVKKEDALKAEHNGRTYYFCEQFCLDKFRQNPDNFLERHGEFLKTEEETEGEK